ncbi:toxin [Streptomyces sp. NPDC059176]|uniref:toxin n=1 Tax=unclassified Streptomyces TaxID=2593676 RepID=UPI00367BA1C9
MNNKELRRYCADIVKSLDIPERADVNVLCDRMEELRGRPISLMELPMPTGVGKPCGLWLSTDDVDYIGYQKFTTQAHQQHIIRHELGHMMCGHEAAPVMPDEVIRLLMPRLAPDLVRSVLGRTQYSNEEERAAELVASLMPMQGDAVVRRPSTNASPGMANLITHIGRSLERS